MLIYVLTSLLPNTLAHLVPPLLMVAHLDSLWCFGKGCEINHQGIDSERGLPSEFSSCPTLCDPMNCSTPGLPVHYKLLELAQTRIHWVGDAIQPSHPLSPPSPPAFNFSQHQVLFKWVSSLHQVAKILEFQPQHQSFQWIFRTDFL